MTNKEQDPQHQKKYIRGLRSWREENILNYLINEASQEAI